MMSVPSIAAAALLFASMATAFAANDPKVVFSEKCALCHGKDGRAQTEIGKKVGAKDLTAKEAQSLTDTQIQTQVAKGKGRMPGYEGILTSKEIAEMTKFLRTLK